MPNLKHSFIVLLLSAIFISGCQIFSSPEPTPTPLPPEPTPEPAKELSICLGYEPQSLNPFLANSQAAHDVLQAIYDGPIDTVNGMAVPVILEDMPSLGAGSASFTTVDVRTGDEVINTAGYPESLRAGTRVFPGGCFSSDCAITWDGSTPLQVNQLTATYRLKPGVSWSDGQALSAFDSVYGFQIAADPATPLDRRALNQTLDYQALDEQTIQWVGKPGLVTDAFEDYFWMPLPQHAWGESSPQELLSAEEPNRRPLGWGAYEVAEWVPGELIRLSRNPYYFRASEGLPYFDTIQFRFLQFKETQEILTAGKEMCDIITPSAAEMLTIQSAADDPSGSDFLLQLQPTNRVEVIPLGIKPASYDDRYYPYGEDRPDIFGDVRVRQALAYCIDRENIINSIFRDSAVTADSILVADHDLLDGVPLTRYSYDPGRGMALLEEAGWMDYDQNPDTARTSFGTALIPPDTLLEVSLHFSEADLRASTAERIAANLGECGFKVNETSLPMRELYQHAPEGIVFGRKFDLALMSWELGYNFRCELFMTNEIPTATNNWLGGLTGGWNFMGFSSPLYDEACGTFNNLGIEDDTARNTAQNMLEILSSDVPFIPLFHYSDPYLVNRQVCGLHFDASAGSIFQGIESISDRDCPY